MIEKLFIVDGPSAAGKSELQKHIEENYPRIAVVTKQTTRRQEDKAFAGAFADQKVVTNEEFNRLAGNPDFIWYEFSGYRYGFYWSDLVSEPESSAAFIVVRDLNVISRLKSLASLLSVRAVALYLHADLARRYAYLKANGYSEMEIEKRLGRDRPVYPGTRRFHPLYDAHIDNSQAIDDIFEAFFHFV